MPRWTYALSAAPVFPSVSAGSLIVVPLRTGSIVAVRQKDGGEAWTIKFAAEQPLAADETHVYVVSGEAIRAIRASDGGVAWVAEAGTVTAPPFVRDGWVLLASGSTLTAFRTADGSRIWEKVVGPMEFPCDVDGDVVFVPVVDGRMVALDLKTGDVRWEQKLGGAPGEPLAVGGRVYVGAEDKRFYWLSRTRRHQLNFRPGQHPRAAGAGESRVFRRHGQRGACVRSWNGALREKGLPFRPAAARF